MSLLSLAIQELGYTAVSLTGSQCGIITSDSHSNAKIIDIRPVRVEDEVRRGNIVIVAGFQGMSYRREITTLGRGGSDTTAVAWAAALDSKWCEICSDVEGCFSSTDPNAVPEARPAFGNQFMTKWKLWELPGPRYSIPMPSILPGARAWKCG